MSYILHIEPQGNVAMKLPKPKIIKRKKNNKRKKFKGKKKATHDHYHYIKL